MPVIAYGILLLGGTALGTYYTKSVLFPVAVVVFWILMRIIDSFTARHGKWNRWFAWRPVCVGLEPPDGEPDYSRVSGWYRDERGPRKYVWLRMVWRYYYNNLGIGPSFCYWLPGYEASWEVGWCNKAFPPDFPPEQWLWKKYGVEAIDRKKEIGDRHLQNIRKEIQLRKRRDAMFKRGNTNDLSPEDIQIYLESVKNKP